MHRKAISSRTIGDSLAKRIWLGEGEIIANDCHSWKIHANLAKPAQTRCSIIHPARRSGALVSGGVWSVRQSLGVYMSVIVLYSSRKCDKLFRRTGVHTMAIDLHWGVTLWAYIYEVFSVTEPDKGVFYSCTACSTCNIEMTQADRAQQLLTLT